MYNKIKYRTFKIVQTADDNDKISKAFDFLIISLIIINTITIIADTFDLSATVKTAFSVIETVSVIIFTIEYALRLWTADLLYKDASSFKSRLKFIFSFMAIIDLLAIFPFYIPFLIPIDLRILRVLRVVRLFRLFKINRYTDAFSMIGNVLKSKANQLLSSIFSVSLLMIISSILMYNVENAAQPDKFVNAFSGLWWAVATLTTVGYGDIYPVTVFGKILSATIAILGIGLVAVPTGIISAGFIEQIEKSKEKDKKEFCPYCGHKLDE